MDVHPQLLVAPDVEIHVTERGPRIPIAQPAGVQLQGLLVEAAQVRTGDVRLLVDTGWKHIVHRCTVAVLLDVHCRHVEGGLVRITADDLTGRLQSLCVLAPFPAYEIQPCKAQHHRLCPAFDNEPHEADRAEVLDPVHRLLRLPHRHFELVPVYFLPARGMAQDPVRDEVLAHYHVRRPQFDTVLEVALALAEVLVLVEVLRGGQRGGL